MMLSFRTLVGNWLRLCVAAAMMACGLWASRAQTVLAPRDVASLDESLGKTRAFDVVSIRPSPVHGVSMARIEADGYQSLGMPLTVVISSAYWSITYSSRDFLIGAPDWVWHDKYDFVGKVAPEDVVAWQNANKGLAEPNEMLKERLQAALAERCKLVLHRVPAETTGFVLVLGKHGAKLKEAQPDEVIPSTALHISDDGMMIPIMSPDNPVLTFFHTSMASLAKEISHVWGRPVSDETGLTGKYDFMVPKVVNDPDPSVALDVGSIGLMLKPVKVPTFAIVVDHIERPSEN